MMWRALTQTSTVALLRALHQAAASAGGFPTYARDQTLDVAYRCFRQHAMAEIENERSLRESGQNSIDRTVQSRAASEQDERIEITLNWPPLLDHRSRKFELDGPIEPHGVDRNRIEVARELRAGATRKADNSRSRNLPTNLFNNANHRLDAPHLEFQCR